MKFVKCKNETGKLQAIADYCKDQIAEYTQWIKWYDAEKTSPLDYMEEVDELRTRIAHFERIIYIIEADEFTSVLVV